MPDNKTKVLYMLSQEDTLSGEAMSQRLGISRTAIWKHIEQLRAEGYSIISSGKSGYALLPDENDIRPGSVWQGLRTQWAGKSMEYYDTISSTNIMAVERARGGFPQGHVVLSEHQTGGLGRRKRAWHSPRGAGVYLSIVLRPDIAPNHIARLTMVSALAAVYALRDLGLDAAIKWPNDIVVNAKKVCGILLQMSTDMDTVEWVVAGLGMNFATPSLPEIAATATGINAEAGRAISRAEYVRRLLYHIESLYDIALDEALHQQYTQHLANLGRRVKVLESESAWEGEAVGIDADGALLVRDDEGKTHQLVAGDVSVRGLMGYI